MIPCLYASMETKFDNNGIGKLADAQSCIVTEKRNGSFELEMVYPADGIHAEQLEEGNIILAKPSDTGRSQPFRIYKIATPIDGKLTVKARHISYQLNFITVSPFATTGCTGALAGLGNHAASECPFEVWTDISSSASFRLSVPSSFRNCLGGIDGSVLDTFGGEYEWDRYTVKLHHHRGADHGVHIVYGKNLIDFKMEKNIESVITGVHPYWQNSETGEVTELPEKVVLVEQRSVPYQKITVLDCTSGFQDKPTDEMLRSFAQDYLKNTSLTEPQVDIDIDFIQLWNTPDYEDVVEAEQVSLCDTVHVFISKLGIEVSSKVTETQYDCLLERYDGITLSNSTVSSRNSSLTTALSNIRNTANEAYNTALRVETSMGEQIGGISVSMVYDGTLLAGLFGLHYQNVTEVNGETVRYAFNAGSLAKSTFAWKNSPAGFFISTDGGKTWGYGWEKDESPVKTALLLENTLQELDERYKKAGELTEELLEQLDERYKTASALSEELIKSLDARYGTADKLSEVLLAQLDERYKTASALSEELIEKLDERYGTADKLSETLLAKLDERYAPPICAQEAAPKNPKTNALWVDTTALRLKLWDGEIWQTVGYEPPEPEPDPDTPTEGEAKKMANRKAKAVVQTAEEPAQEALVTKSFTVFQDVELSFTENLIPTHIPVKQYDNQARKVRCRLYQNSLEYKVSKDTIVSYSATRPDGAVFQYSSETRPDLVFVDDGAVILTVTSFMTEVYGRFPIDIYLLSDEGDVIGSFSLVLNVARAAVKNGKIATLTYKQALDAAAKGVLEFLITDDGYLVMRSDDKLGLAQGSVSSTIDKVAKDIAEGMVTSSINMDGHLVFQSWDALGLIFEMDDEGHLIVRYNEA